jgi:tellurite resistance protein TehA-like permease
MQTTRAIKFILAAWSFGVIGMLLFFMWRVAYFYEKTSGQRVSYYLLTIPALSLTAGAIWYLVHNVEFVGEPVGDVLLLVGGVVLFLFCVHLQEVMTGERR